MSYSVTDNTMNNTYIGDPLSPTPTYTIGTIGSPGQVLTSTGTGSLNWSNLNGTSTSWNTISADPNLQGRTLQVNGDADITGELTVQGVKLSDRLDKIDERLAILHPNEKLEKKWDELKELGRRYRELEAEIIEKERVWAILNK